jgi:hypothetical protein
MAFARFHHCRDSFPARVSLLAIVLVAGVSAAKAEAKRKNPASKIYVADVSGEAVIDTGKNVEDLSRRSVYSAQGSVIETKKPESEADRGKYFSTMVYSNGTGAFFDADTRVEVKRFQQEPFTPNRADVEVEPSISQTQAYVSRGTVGLCTSKLVAGSSMTYQTPLGAVTIRGRKLVIEAKQDVTKISMLEGESTIRAGAMDLGGHTIKAGEQAVIRRGAAGQPNQITISAIPANEAPQLDDQVALACMAKKTVYFEVQERAATASDTAAAGSTTDASGAVTAFDSSSATVREIVPVEVLAADLPVQFTVSPSRLGTSSNTLSGR